MWIIPYAVIALGVIALDQISKLLVLEFLYEGQLVLIEGVFNFTYVENRGMAFGLLADHRWVFMVFSTIGIALVAAYLWFYVKGKLGRTALALVIGGGIGNMIDRVAYGFVVDFIDFCAFDFWKWIFNIADSAVCVGAGMFILYLILDTVKELKKQKAPTELGGGDDAADS
ncbi:MAG: signal peptidase II [Clostridia bacterium]|nr:signal peptidase II [Clostridia bacterium]